MRISETQNMLVNRVGQLLGEPSTQPAIFHPENIAPAMQPAQAVPEVGRWHETWQILRVLSPSIGIAHVLGSTASY